jgi:hypothetical protein
MIPEGGIFRHLRRSMLEFFSVANALKSPPKETMAEWLQLGYLTPLDSDVKSVFLFSTSAADLPASIYHDVERLQNHVFEHIIEIISYNECKSSRSEAWSVVTLYYFGFFTAQTILRLIGQPVFHISDSVSKNLNNSIGVQLSPGAFQLTLAAPISANSADFKIQSLKKRHHDAVWNRLFGILENAKANARDSGSADAEITFYQILEYRSTKKIYNSSRWPSEIRNLVNYRPGFGYRLSSDEFFSKSKNLLNRWRSLDQTKLLKIHLESSTANSSEFSTQVMHLHDLSFSLFILLRKLYAELTFRRPLSEHWEKNRQSMLAKSALDLTDFSFVSHLPKSDNFDAQ